MLDSKSLIFVMLYFAHFKFGSARGAAGLSDKGFAGQSSYRTFRTGKLFTTKSLAHSTHNAIVFIATNHYLV